MQINCQNDKIYGIKYGKDVSMSNKNVTTGGGIGKGGPEAMLIPIIFIYMLTHKFSDYQENLYNSSGLRF